MDNSILIRETILQNLKREFGGAVVTELNGNYFKAADVSLPNGEDTSEVYRVAIIKHENKRDFGEMLH